METGGSTAMGGRNAGGGTAGSSRGGTSGGSTQAGADSDGDAGSSGGTDPDTSFFVTSDKSATANLGGLPGADARCQALAEAVGLGSKTWRAYLSVEVDPQNDDMPTHARDRIGTGPWRNANGALLANDLDELHALTGNPDLFVDEHGRRIPGQWAGSPTPNEHDILTGTTPEGTVAAGFTCADWTSESADSRAQVGHSDGLGPMMNPNPPYSSWNSAHTGASCDNTAPMGGAGRIYCFAAD
jgi:hypothetical protein